MLEFISTWRKMWIHPLSHSMMHRSVIRCWLWILKSTTFSTWLRVFDKKIAISWSFFNVRCQHWFNHSDLWWIHPLASNVEQKRRAPRRARNSHPQKCRWRSAQDVGSHFIVIRHAKLNIGKTITKGFARQWNTYNYYTNSILQLRVPYPREMLQVFLLLINWSWEERWKSAFFMEGENAFIFCK